MVTRFARYRFHKLPAAVTTAAHCRLERRTQVIGTEDASNGIVGRHWRGRDRRPGAMEGLNHPAFVREVGRAGSLSDADALRPNGATVGRQTGRRSTDSATHPPPRRPIRS